MSRRGFRVAVGEPRPTSAWLLVFVATATLAITGQLEPWALAATGAAFAISLWRRTGAFAWQTNPWLLNALMMGITTGTTWVALQGQPSTVALAHFAATTQGLQLIDARPRKTEFLLVALALFQVVLAANLTDSVFFTPLLVAFVFAAVWTLVVHTLRSEALEAGQAREIPRAFTPGLARTAFAASAVAVLLAMLLFVALPRLQASVVRGPLIGGALAASGFSDRVELGALGRIRSDPSVVMRVETLEGRPPGSAAAYWRGLAFDTFDGRTWSITPPERTLVPGSAEGGVGLGLDPDRYDLVQRIVREPVEAGVLFRIGDPRGIQGTIRRLERDASGGLYAASQADERIRYTVRSLRAQPDDDDLRDDRALPPRRGGERLLARAPLSPAVGRARGADRRGREERRRARARDRALPDEERPLHRHAARSAEGRQLAARGLPVPRARRSLRVLRVGDGGARARGRPARTARERLRGRAHQRDRQLRRGRAEGRARVGRDPLRARGLGALRPDARRSARPRRTAALVHGADRRLRERARAVVVPARRRLRPLRPDRRAQARLARVVRAQLRDGCAGSRGARAHLALRARPARVG
jgi:hypothetical protein